MKIRDHADNANGLQMTAQLSCTGALSPRQAAVFTATTDAFLFVYDVSKIPEGEQVDCAGTENVPDGYRAGYRPPAPEVVIPNDDKGAMESGRMAA